METTFYVVRHGETDWNATGRWQGLLDVPLNEVGRAQARRLSQRLLADGLRLDAIYSSDLSRAFETAQIVGAALGHEARPLEALREIDIGVWSGLQSREIRERYPEEFARLEAGDDVKRGGAESLSDLMRRVGDAVEQLAARHPGQRLALFTHGGCVRALLLYAQASSGGPPTHYRGHIGNTSLTTLTHNRGGWRVGVVNDQAHLEGEALTPDDAERPSDHQV